MTELTIARAAAEDTRFGPGLAAAAADLARAAQRNFERNHGAAPGFAARHRNFGRVRVVTPGAFAEERIADTRHEIADRRKVDRDLIGKTIVRPLGVVTHGLVRQIQLHPPFFRQPNKDTERVSRLSRHRTDANVTRIMPEESGPTRECPMCGCTMQLKKRETVVHLPGNPSGTKSKAAEWVCPDCDYFEELEG